MNTLMQTMKNKPEFHRQIIDKTIEVYSKNLDVINLFSEVPRSSTTLPPTISPAGETGAPLFMEGAEPVEEQKDELHIDNPTTWWNK